MRILILSRNTELYSTKSLFNAARRRNHFVRVIDHMHCNLLVSNTGNRLYYHDQLIEGYDAIIPRIGHTVTKQGEAVIRHFESMNVYTVLRAEALLRARDKLSCLQLLASKGVKVPETIFISSQYSVDKLTELIPGYPKIIKLLSGTHGLGVLKTDNRSSMDAILELLAGLKQRSLLQEFISESSGMDVRAFVVDNGLKVAGVDMLISHNGPLIIEVNASPGLEGIETYTGVDVAKTIIQLIERKALSIKKSK